MAGLADYFIASSRCGRVNFLAAPFGYGPRVSAEHLACLLNLTIDPWEKCSHGDRNLNGRAKLLLNFEVEDFEPREQHSPFRVWVDCLLWLRRSLPARVLEYEMIIAQSFFPIRSGYLRMPNVRVISPLIDFADQPQPKHSHAGADYVLISFGGIETPYTQDIHRFLIPGRVLDSIVEAAELLGDTRQIICCAPPSHVREFSRVKTFSRVKFVSPTHGEYLRLLRRADLNIMQPGLFGPFEAFASRVPTALCPPFSYTQLCQARKYEELGLLGDVPLWSVFDREMASFEGELITEEPVCFQDFADWFQRNLSRGEHRDTFIRWATNALEESLVSAELTTRRANYFESCASFPKTHLRVLSQHLL